jgi:hypothetical protein
LQFLENSLNGASYLQSKSKTISSISSTINRPSFKRSSTYSSSSVGNVTVLEKIQKISPLHQKKIQSLSADSLLKTTSKINLYKSKTVEIVPSRCQSAPPASVFDYNDDSFIDFYGNDQKENTINKIEADYSNTFKPPEILKANTLPIDISKKNVAHISFSSHLPSTTQLFSAEVRDKSFEDQISDHSDDTEKELIRFDMYTHIDPASPFALKSIPDCVATDNVPSVLPVSSSSSSSKFSPFAAPRSSSGSRTGTLDISNLESPILWILLNLKVPSL